MFSSTTPNVLKPLHLPYVFIADENDTIEDFTDREDLIDLTAFSGITDFDSLTVTAVGGDTAIDLTGHGGGTIRLESFDDANLDATDFLFYEPLTDTGSDGA